MLIGMPLASTMGLAGSPVKPMVIPWLLNRNGQAITLNNKLKQAGVRDPKALKPLVDKAKAAGDPLTFAMTFPPGTHAMWMRYWLASGGIHPDKDVSLITIPPPQMVANMKVDKMDGFCVGEPWNNRAIADGIGFTAITTQQMWQDHPEKVCAFTEEFAAQNPKTVKAILKALHLASVHLDKLENRRAAAEIISRPTYINCPPEIILERLLGKYDYGDGRKEQDPNYMIFSDRQCNYPQPIFGTWWLTQFRRWGMVKGAPDYAGVSKRVLRPDIYLEAMKEMGVTPKVAELPKFTLFDSVARRAAIRRSTRGRFRSTASLDERSPMFENARDCMRSCRASASASRCCSGGAASVAVARSAVAASGRGRRARSTSSSRSRSAARWIRASGCSPTTAWCAWRRASCSASPSRRRSASCSACRRR